jgi:hypothetical protein
MNPQKALEEYNTWEEENMTVQRDLDEPWCENNYNAWHIK